MGNYDVESFLGTIEQLHGSASDIGAHQVFQQPEFFMPELLPKEIWTLCVQTLPIGRNKIK